MNKRNHFIKVRLSDTEYQSVRRRSDAEGVNMSDHVRATLTTVHESIDVAAELAKLRQQLSQATSVSSSLTGTEQREVLLLLRELAAARDAQILARVRAQIAARSAGENRGGAQ